jgi:hypothetical protein
MAAVYALPDAFVLIANHRTQAGFWIAGQPITRLSSTASDAEIGAALHAVLHAGQSDLPTPTRAEYPQRLRELATAAGVRTWAALEKVARLCTVEEGARGVLKVVPHRHGGTRGPEAGYHELAELAFEPAGGGDAALGAATRRGIELSSGPPAGRAT